MVSDSLNLCPLEPSLFFDFSIEVQTRAEFAYYLLTCQLLITITRNFPEKFTSPSTLNCRYVGG